MACSGVAVASSVGGEREVARGGVLSACGVGMERVEASGHVVISCRAEIPGRAAYERVIRRGGAAGVDKGSGAYLDHAHTRTDGLIQVESAPDEGISTDVQLPGWAGVADAHVAAAFKNGRLVNHAGGGEFGHEVGRGGAISSDLRAGRQDS